MHLRNGQPPGERWEDTLSGYSLGMSSMDFYDPNRSMGERIILRLPGQQQRTERGYSFVLGTTCRATRSWSRAGGC